MGNREDGIDTSTFYRSGYHTNRSKDEALPLVVRSGRRQHYQHRIDSQHQHAPTLSIYVASKSAVDGLTRVLSKELGPRKIRVNSLNPGATETEGAHAAGVMGSEFEKELVAHTPLGRFGQPEDIARVAVFLASDDAGWLTGEVILASGGHK
jgi:NAD(P)-dependent dehydrogenase (short-subunit alcohol dehydrogenase family)